MFSYYYIELLYSNDWFALPFFWFKMAHCAVWIWTNSIIVTVFGLFAYHNNRESIWQINGLYKSMSTIVRPASTKVTEIQ